MKEESENPFKSSSKPEGKNEELEDLLPEASLARKKKTENSHVPTTQKEIPIHCFYYINKNKVTLSDLKNGRRIFNNKTELQPYNENDPNFNQKFIEFRQLFFENLMLNENFTENPREKVSIESALLSTFVYEEDFVEPMINALKFDSIIIRHREGIKYNQMEERSGNDRINFVFPKIEQTLKWGKFHSKLMLLKFPTFLRVVVPSANLTNCDWYFWGQIIWFQDFPLKKEKNDDEGAEFQAYLQKFLDTFMPHNYVDKRYWTNLEIDLSDYDFSDCCVELVASANGRWSSKDKNFSGIGRISYLTKEKFSNIEKNTHMIIQSSSIGNSKKEKFYSDVYRGFNLTENANIELIYPTTEYINSFKLGKELSSCLFLTREAYQFHKDKFKKMELKEKYKDRKTVIHSKVFITGEKKEGKFCVNDNSIIYFGSHNFSVAALGAYEKKDTQISTANFELGVIFNPNKITFEEKEEIYNTVILNFDSGAYGSQDTPFINDFTNV